MIATLHTNLLLTPHTPSFPKPWHSEYQASLLLLLLAHSPVLLVCHDIQLCKKHGSGVTLKQSHDAPLRIILKTAEKLEEVDMMLQGRL
jgi:hypothetical protein